eukprot:CAMPEP_0170604440 /NCGR_PEP_ID=MMETSP0224-20130122/19423_1 /TAXON_ID=285029 /ORGANISM="Togula jolla, Strain CCCM 725" /LENGTH=107 /DNA_ID=CAMNT_0010929341 /DNA_START=142 /DNA_END=465 /DNA_ORIENTATION=+
MGLSTRICTCRVKEMVRRTQPQLAMGRPGRKRRRHLDIPVLLGGNFGVNVRPALFCCACRISSSMQRRNRWEAASSVKTKASFLRMNSTTTMCSKDAGCNDAMVAAA